MIRACTLSFFILSFDFFSGLDDWFTTKFALEFEMDIKTQFTRFSILIKTTVPSLSNHLANM